MRFDLHDIHDAERALADGNDGRARVSSRRAVAHVAQEVGRLLGRDFGSNAMANLRALKDDPGFSREIREAAARLSGGPRDMATGAPFSRNPVGDARLLIDALVALLPSTDER